MLSMILIGFSTIIGVGPVEAIETSENDQLPSVRIYGEENAIYPTHSYTDGSPYAWDFIYMDETQPFDPGVIQKDSITFNPIFLDHSYGIDANGDACEKVFLRTFYEPEYEHNADCVMSSAGPDNLEAVGAFNAVVTETTYHFVTLDCRQPTVGIFYEDSPDFVPGEHAKMYLPYESCDDTIPGMDYAGLLDIVAPEGPYCFPFGKADASEENLVDGEIAIEKQFTGLKVGDNIEFLDHSIQIKAFEDNDPALDKVTFEIRYEGNPPAYDGLEDIKTQEHYMVESLFGEKYYFNRDNDMRRSYLFMDDLVTPPRTMENAPAFRWYMKIDNAVQEDYITVTVGRELIAGETFYVNGVRYDVPAIYTTSDYDGNWVFKYLTMQSPIPKGDGIIEDFSHVTSQYLTELDFCETVWVLPPYNMDDHIMVDDIGLEKQYDEIADCWCIPTNGLLIEDPKEALDFCYIEETIEPRFDSTLAERLNTEYYWDEWDVGKDIDMGAWIIDYEEWLWYNIYTKPYRFTEFRLPDQEVMDDPYADDCFPIDYAFWYADGFEYLITTSFIAPNSETGNQYRGDVCKYDIETHEIYNRAHEIEDYVMGYNSDPNYAYCPRATYEYDAYDGTDLYINEYNDDVSVRIYGEDDAIYPTHSGVQQLFDETPWDCAMDYWYQDETQVFDPGVVLKDSITFNPVYLDGEVYGTYAKGDASEKIFLRAFYEPGYNHAEDCLMSYSAPDELFPVGPFDAVVTETTYHFVTLHDRQPTVGVLDESRMWLPYESCDDSTPGMDYGGLLTIVYPEGPYDCQLVQVRDENHEAMNGHIAVEKQFTGLQVGDNIEFMDHSIQLKMFEDNDPMFDKITFEVRYEGNPPEYNGLEDIKAQEHSIDENCFNEKYYFNRDNDIRESFEFLGDLTIEERSCQDAAAFRWYLKVDNAANSEYITLTLGRELFAGETFYVNGMRYDIPAVYQKTDDYYRDVFKYLTFQSPIPKGDGITEDFSHVTSQYLTELDYFETVWVLPPYNMDDRVVIDDIGLEKYYDEYEDCYTIPSNGIMFEDTKDALDFCYVEETIEPRFNTSIAERLQTECEGYEHWEWWNVFTLPNHYTAFVLPNEEIAGEAYADAPEWYPYVTADGFEYIISTSWTAQNSEFGWIEDDCKPYDVHDIRQFWVSQTPKMTFEFDAEDDTGLFINEGEMPDDYPPTAVPGGPYSGQTSVCCDANIYFNGCSSHDNDESGSAIVQYDWNFGDGTGWHDDMGCSPSWQYPAGEYTVYLRVTDNEGDIDTQATTVQVTSHGEDPQPTECDITIAVEDINIEGESYGSGWVKVLVDPAYTGEVNIVKFTVSWDESVVTLADTDVSSAWDMVTSIDTVAGQMTVTAYKYGAGFTSDTNIFKLSFGKAAGASSGDECALELSGVSVAVGAAYISEFCEEDGRATIDGGSVYPEGDINLDGNVDELDVYLLGTAVLYGDSIPPQADGDMNNDGTVDELDVYLLGTQVIGS